MEVYDVPEDIIDHIARKIHKEYYSETLKELQRNYMFQSVYKRSLTDSEFFIIDDWVDWTTVVIKLENNAFILYHEFFERPFSEELIAEGTYKGNVYTFHRFAYKQYRPHTETITDLDSYLETRKKDIPLEYLARVLSSEGTYNDPEFIQHKHCKSVEGWDRIVEWHRELIMEFEREG